MSESTKNKEFTLSFNCSKEVLDSSNFKDIMWKEFFKQLYHLKRSERIGKMEYLKGKTPSIVHNEVYGYYEVSISFMAEIY